MYLHVTWQVGNEFTCQFLRKSVDLCRVYRHVPIFAIHESYEEEEFDLNLWRLFSLRTPTVI